MAQKASVVRIEGMEGRDPSRRRDRRSLRTRAVRGAILAVGAEAVAALEDLIVEAYVGRVHRRERRLGELDLVLGVKLPRVLCSRLYSDLCELQYIKLEKASGLTSGTMNGRCGRIMPTPRKNGRLAFTATSIVAITCRRRR